MRWRMKIAEPSLDELLADEMMLPVMRSAGIDKSGLRALLAELARRVPADRLTRPCGCSTERGCQPSAA